MPNLPPQPEQLGSFFLGARVRPESSKLTDEPVHYDARDLTTHAVCVGMTGSGKTGLCVGLLEEAAIDRVPAIIIDPKGDMGNLLLHFDKLRPEDFGPWVNADDARRKGLSKEQFAANTADLWRAGLKDWGIGEERIRRLSETVDFNVFSPGSSAAEPVNVLGSFEPPQAASEEEIHEHAQGIVSALLGLIGVEADPVTSREATLLAVLIEHFWSEGITPDAAMLIRAIPEPPVRQFGVFDVDSFFPAKDRFNLAMRFNNLLASPNFGAWMEGKSLDISSILYSDDGKPRHSIFYIAHLSDEERMFFVTLLLENLVSWMRLQPGTTSLRALLYFDEIFGFMPPVAEPPSKRALLTILKQGRAFGLGTVLVTQNPVDLDYKALSNAGTWFIGRLQSEQDQARLLDGLKRADAASSGAARIESAIGKLKSRVFLLHNVHEDEPILFHTRWVMNYLRGPLTRNQLKDLPHLDNGSDEKGAAEQRVDQEDDRKATRLQDSASKQDVRSSSRPAMPQGIDEAFLTKPASAGVQDGSVLVPFLGAHVSVTFYHRKYQIETSKNELILHSESDDSVDWSDASSIAEPFELSPVEPAGTHSYNGHLPAAANTEREMRSAGRKLEDYLYTTRKIELKVVPSLEICQAPDETDAAFYARAELAAREIRDGEVDALVDKYEDRIERLEDRLRDKEATVADREAEVSSRQQEEWLKLGETVLGMVLGGRRRSLSGSATKRRMTARARRRLERALDDADDIRTDIEELRRESQEAVQEITDKWARACSEVEVLEVKPRRSDIQIQWIGIVWA